jgi:CarD family transcriptional regulator
MYQVGDLVLYGNTGICRVADISSQDLTKKSKDQLYYVLVPLYQNCTISTPVNSTKVFMRPIISKDEAERLIQSIPGIRAQAYYNRTLHELTEHYEASLKTHNCTDLIELCMSIYAKKTQLEEQKRKFGSIDERYMKRAEELLFGELAAALCIPKEQMPGYIARIINERRWNY